MSGAEPWIGSYRPRLESDRDADANIPIEPEIIDASSERISPKILFVRITSN